jgi:hypothetical protein
MKTNNSKSFYTEGVSTKLTPKQYGALMDAADAAGMTESQYLRYLIVSALDLSQSERRAIAALTIGEERVRLMLEAVQDKQRLDAPDVKSGIEMEALSAGIRLAEQRIATLLSVRLGPPR